MPISFPLFGRANPEATSGPPEWLIVGLGNPGQKYIDTRHNAGWHLLDTIVRDYPQFRFDEKRSKGLIARAELSGVRIALLKPQTYMNLSGEAVAPIARFYKIPPERILVAFDDLDLPLASLRLRLKGGAGGHNGMSNIIQHLGTKDFPRLRLGIGRPAGQMPPKAYVLLPFKADEWEAMRVTYERSVDAIKVIITEGMEIAMTRFNTNP
ncbi:MAG TPA: aminoacyl-tRNA hydrolase [Anaerolineae bacterium]|nr:aminoacyl-tRNA hydrolase [Anaerolineae bacterium]HRV95329.1 aminoacyl-tRNA hydrolase [Anaerolineae bacterium]